MRKRISSILLVLALILSFLTVPEIESKAADTCKISFTVEYGQTDARKMFEKVNEFRAENGTNAGSKAPLVYDYNLEKAAMQRAAELAIKYNENHLRPDGGEYKLTLEEYGFDISPRNILYGENILFGTEDSMQLDSAMQLLESKEENRIPMLGYFVAVGIGHVKMEDKTDFWVQLFADEVGYSQYTDPVDGKGIATVTVLSSNVERLNVEYSSGSTTVAAGSTVEAPVYTPKVKFYGSELVNDLELSPLVFESDDGIVKASGGYITGIKAGNGTISAELLGQTFSYGITVTGGSGTPTNSPAPTPTEAPTGTPAPTSAPVTPTQAPTNTVTDVPSVTPTKEVTGIPTAEPSKSVTGTPEPTKEVTTTPTKTPSKPSSAGLMVGETFKKGGYKYKVTDKKNVEVLGATSEKITKVEIPANVTYSGVKYKVTGIAQNAFKGKTSIKSVTIGKNVKEIGKKAFYGCTKLKTLKVKGNAISTIEENAFAKTYSKMNVDVPSKSVKKYKEKLINAGLDAKATIK